MTVCIKTCSNWAARAGMIAAAVVLILGTTVRAEVPDEAKKEFNRGVELTKAKKADSAIVAYEAAVKIDPTYLQAHINVGALYYDKGNMEKAAEHLTKAVGLDSNNVSALKSLGLVHLKEGDFDGAIKAFKMHNALNDSDAGAHLSLAQAYGEKNDSRNALVSYQKAVALDPKDYRTLYNIGNIHMKANRFDDAIDAYTKALALKPDYVEALYNRAISSQSLEDYEQCLADYQAFIKAAQGKKKWNAQVTQAKDIIKQIQEYLDSKG